MPVFQSAAVVAAVWEVAAVDGTVSVLVEQLAGKLVAGIVEDQVLGGQPELDCHADPELADGLQGQTE